MHEELIALASKLALDRQLDPALVCAVIEQESAWNPWAVRFEPEFERRYIHPALPNAPTTEELSLAMSWGLMQVMGQTARENGFRGRFFTALCDPQTGLSFGCRVLARKFKTAKGDVSRALGFWNGGTNPDYSPQVLARCKTYESLSSSSPLHSPQST